MTTPMESRWIWLNESETSPDCYADFRAGFVLPETPDVSPCLRIAADSEYEWYLDGIFQGSGQFPDYPERPTYTEYPLPPDCCDGKRHLLAVRVFYKGVTSSVYTCGDPGLFLALTDVSVRFERVLCRKSPSFRIGKTEFFTRQLGFTMAFDARNEDAWTTPGYDDSLWESAVDSARTVFPVPRPLPRIVPGDVLPSRPVIQGFLLRPPSSDGETRSSAEFVRDDFMQSVNYASFFSARENPDCGAWEIPVPVAPANGAFVIFDLGGEQTGFLDFDLYAPEGATLDISYGEHLSDGRVRAHISGRNFTDRYRCREGRNVFSYPFRRIGARFIQLNLTSFARPVRIRHVSLRPQNLPLPQASLFDDGDVLQSHLRDAALRTMQRCMHEHYEDCPWREQALYAYDSRNQALFGYYAWGNYDFARVSLELLGRGIRSDGLLNLCAPAVNTLTIPIFSFLWFMECRDAYLFSGNDALFREFRSQMECMLTVALGRRDSKTGLVRSPSGDGMWLFYEWADQLCGDSPERSEGAFSAPYNLYLALAVRSFSDMCRYAGESSPFSEENLLNAVRDSFLRPDGLLATFLLPDGSFAGFHEHTNALAVCTGILRGNGAEHFLRETTRRTMVPLTYSVMPFLLDAFAAAGPNGIAAARKRLADEFGSMLFSSGDTLWETSDAEAAFGDAGSLCHAWSSAPIYFQGAYELGIRPLEPGFRVFSWSPYLPERCSRLTGSVPSPHGMIRVDCCRSEDGLVLSVECPAGTTPEIMPLPGSRIASVTVREYESVRDYSSSLQM